MNDKFDVHPDMVELIAAKEAAAKRAATSGARSAWDVYGASMSRPYPNGMSVSDTSFPSARDRSRRIPVRMTPLVGTPFPASAIGCRRRIPVGRRGKDFSARRLDRGTMQGPVGCHLADDRAELDAVAASSCGSDESGLGRIERTDQRAMIR
jgi:hypothetical protein